MNADVTASSGPKHRRKADTAGPASGSIWSKIALLIGAFAFLFPFYYMIIGSLQTEPDSSPTGAFPNPGNLSLHNYAAINSAISLGRSLVNSGIFTGGVIICTTFFGLLAGYALARLHFRGRSSTFALVLLVQVVPFQLLMIPLYVLIVRNYGLADSYLGMILPFAINTSAVFIFRQFFLQLPPAMFEAARMDGASELQILFRIAVPLCRPALVSVVLLSFTGPWNEFLWPFLVTKQQDMQPLAVSLANYISTVSSAAANPFGAILAGACVLAAPAVALYIAFQSRFSSTDIDSATKG
ncbi:carbohydrate ABC transporter permease [Streptomyces sp. NPDC002133]|uniref:carbohydrate ABC transporter permease n=1 Tax=Streptomyces sp. NPDC002133 TaxID=3154409 RepID=UPI0033241899